MEVLVTGGSGFVGTRLQKKQKNWTYISSKDYDLTVKDHCRQMLLDTKPDVVLHLAGKVGGIKENNKKQADFYYINTMINTNILEESYRAGVGRVLSSLSTCAFPDKLDKYPFTEEDLLKGPPAVTNFSYGYAKRSLFVQSLSYSRQCGVNYNCFCPSNLYGPDDNFDLESGHFVPNLIRKVFESGMKKNIELWGTGKPLRQQLYVDDLVQLIPVLIEKHKGDSPLIVAPNENYSIRELANLLIEQLDRDFNIVFNNELDGQFRKDGDNKRLLDVVGDYNFTTFKEGVMKTYEWYEKNYEKQ
jgi:GDP-L-fucose synthase